MRKPPKRKQTREKIDTKLFVPAKPAYSADPAGVTAKSPDRPAPTGRAIVHLLLILAVVAVVYSNTFSVPFIFDDNSNIVDNPVIRDPANFTSSMKGYAFNPRRFIGYASFAANYHFGKLSVVGYHIVNFTIHVVNAILVYFLVTLIFTTPYLNGQLAGEGKRKTVALFSALFFASHPVQTQAVTYIVQRFASLATLFYLLSVVLYVRGRLSQAEVQAKKNQAASSSSAYAFTCFFLSLFSAVLAMKTKEIAFTLPLVIIICEFVFFGSPSKKKLLFLIPVLLTLAIIPVSIVGTDKPLGNILSDLSSQTRVQTHISRWDYLVTEFGVITTYIRLLFLPINQNLDYDYPVYHSLFTPVIFASFLFLSALLGTALYLLYRSRARPSVWRIAAFGILWFFVTLSVESSVIPISDVIYEHRLYLPSVGAFIAIVSSIFVVTDRLKGRRPKIELIVLSSLAFILIVLSAAAYARNTVWRDPITLWKDVVEKSPRKAGGHYELANLLSKGDRIDEAIEQYRIALELKPNFVWAHNNLGITYRKKGHTEKAIEHYKVALGLKPDFVLAHNNLGNIYLDKGLTDEAIEEYKTALTLEPHFALARYNLGRAYRTKEVSTRNRQGRTISP